MRPPTTRTAAISVARAPWPGLRPVVSKSMTTVVDIGGHCRRRSALSRGGRGPSGRLAAPPMPGESGRHQAQQLGGQRLRHLDAVDPGRHDAAGITRAFAGRVEAGHIEALQVPAARDAQR